MSGEGGWTAIPKWLLFSPDITTTEKFIFLTINSFVGGDGPFGEMWPSQETIAGRAGCSVATVKRAIRRLADFGVLEVHTHTTPTGRRNHYVTRSGPPL